MRNALPWSLAGLGVALVAAGLAVVLGSATDPTVVYGGGYAPLQPDGPYRSELALTFDDAVRWTDGQLVGGGLVVLGLLMVTGVGGWFAGFRASGRRAS